VKTIHDALYNWLTIKVVADARPNDGAAIETLTLFETILNEDFLVTELKVVKVNNRYLVTYVVDGKSEEKQFHVEMIDNIHNQIQQNPDRYKIYPN
jgi:hypothetical protein